MEDRNFFYLKNVLLCVLWTPTQLMLGTIFLLEKLAADRFRKFSFFI